MTPHHGNSGTDRQTGSPHRPQSISSTSNTRAMVPPWHKVHSLFTFSCTKWGIVVVSRRPGRIDLASWYLLRQLRWNREPRGRRRWGRKISSLLSFLYSIRRLLLGWRWHTPRYCILQRPPPLLGLYILEWWTTKDAASAWEEIVRIAAHACKRA
jgi:hypothetical protein